MFAPACNVLLWKRPIVADLIPPKPRRYFPYLVMWPPRAVSADTHTHIHRVCQKQLSGRSLFSLILHEIQYPPSSLYRVKTRLRPRCLSALLLLFLFALRETRNLVDSKLRRGQETRKIAGHATNGDGGITQSGNKSISVPLGAPFAS